MNIARGRIPVMVTGVGGGGHGEQILKALRLAKTKYEIVGTDVTPYSSGLGLVDHPYLVPRASEPGYVGIIGDLCRKHSIKALFHGSEPELMVLSESRGMFEDMGVFLPLNPPAVIDRCMNKAALCEFLDTHGFKSPRFRRVTAVEEAMSFPHLPAILKPSVGGGGSAGVFLIQTPEMMRLMAMELLRVYRELVLQDYVGRPDQEYTVGVLHDMDGVLLNSIAVRRFILSALSNRLRVPNRTGRDDLGPVLAISNGVSQGEIGRFPEVTGECERIAAALGTRASVNVQCRLVGRDVHVFEINPRFSGTTSLRAMVGYNEPDILIRKHVLGEPIEQHFPYESAVIVRSLNEVVLRDPKFPTAASAVS